MCEELRLERFDQSPWGFRLTGGLDFGTPLSVIKVTGGSVAELGGVNVGDLVLDINGKNAKNMTHTDAQSCIAAAKNRLSLNVMRGSLVTPQDMTPLRGMTPMIDSDFKGSKNLLNAEELKEHLTAIAAGQGSNGEDGLKDPAIIHETMGVCEVTKSQIISRSEEKVETVTQCVDPNVTDVELAELLTGNEEVLDQGVLGINFQKFIPQVDFIRQSEVFKFLQNENTFKEIPEEVQLKKEPEKRFSTFLMKPKPPPGKPMGPLWHYPKAPNYLPRGKGKEEELPKRRIKKTPPPTPSPKPKPASPPIPPKEDDGHTVLWLFLGETGDNVIDERWGSEIEERENLSRNTNRDEDDISISSSCKYCGKECQCRPESRMSEIREKIEKSKIQEESNEDYESNEHVAIKSQETQRKNEMHTEISTSSKEVNQNSQVSNGFSRQLADIQAQIAELDEQAPSELQTHLVAVQEQLAKIAKMQMKSSKRIEETQIEMQSTKTTYEEYETEERSEKTEYEERKYEERFEEQKYKEEKYEEKFETYTKEEKQEYSESIEESLSQDIHTEETQFREEREHETQEQTEYEDNETTIHAFKKGEYEMCEAPGPPKKKALPLTPQMRPIVLPGGRMWRQPKDAAHEEFYQGILVAQADVLVGTAEGINFTKYVPPKFDMSHSAVYRLIHEIEDRTKENLEKEKMERECYNAPLSKRQLYLATLPQPPPIGEVELKDL